MNSKKIIFGLVFLGIIVLFSGIGSAVECGAIPTNNCTVSVSTTFNTDTYFLNGSTATNTGAININGSNLELNCNSSTFIGNFTTNGYFIYSSARQNLTIRNCISNSYYRHYQLSSLKNVTVNNVTQYNASNLGIDLSTVSNSSIINSRFVSTFPYSNDTSGRILFEGTNLDVNITNNFFYNDNTGSSIFIRLSSTGTSRINIEGNNFTSTGSLSQTPTAIRLDTLNNYTLIRNNTFNGLIGMRALSGARHITLTNNRYFGGYNFIRTANVTNLSAENNTITGGRFIYAGTQGTTETDFIIRNNFIGNVTLNSAGGDLISSMYFFNNIINFLIDNNRFYNVTGTGSIAGNFLYFDTANLTSVNVSNNIFNYSSLALGGKSTSSTNTFNIINNTFANGVGNYDSYSNGILTQDFNLMNIDSNRFEDYCGAIILHNNSNSNITNNIFSTSLSSLKDKGINCGFEPVTAIGLQEYWKGWTPVDQGASAGNIGNTTLRKSQNITILNNNFSGYPIKLREQGGINIIHDLTNYWLRTFQTPVYLYDIENMFLDNNFNNATTVTNQSSGQSYNVEISEIIGNNFRGSTGSGRTSVFTINQNYLLFQSFNVSGTQHNIYNLSNLLAFNQNGTVYCTTISNCDQVNITGLVYGHNSTVLNNFNLTEGVTRQFSPLSISGSTTSKTITSQLSQAITATVVVNVDCEVIGTARYRGDAVTEEDCTNDQATFILTDIPTGESILSLELNQAIIDICAESDITFTDAAGIAGLILVIILVGGAVAMMLLSFTGVGGIDLGRFKPAELTLTELIWGIVIVGLTFLILATMAFVIGGSYCPAITA